MNVKLLMTAFISFPLFLSSCSKDSKSANESDGIWTVYRTPGTEYNLMVSTTTRQEIDGFKVLTATSTEDTSTPKSINFWFKEWPTSSGNYQPVEFLKNQQLTDKQLGVSLTFPGRDTLYSTGLKFVGFSPDPADSIKVTSNNGELTINIPMMSSYSIFPSGLDSASFKGNIIE